MHYTQLGVCVCIDAGLIHALYTGRGVCVCVCRWRADSCIIHR